MQAIILVDPATLVDDQIAAYEAGDADRFAALYAQDAICTSLPSGRIVADGRAAIHRVWGAMFARSVRTVTIEQRMIDGRYVIDLERVQVMTTGICVQSTAIYLVGDHLIERVWFLDSPPAKVSLP